MKSMISKPHRRERRFFIIGTVCLFCAPISTFATAQEPGGNAEFLSAFADTLLPKGTFAGASELASSMRLVDRAAADPVFADILNQAATAINQRCHQLNAQKFAQSPAAVRNRIFSELEGMPDTELLGWFFDAARAEIFFHYYAQPGMHDTVGLGAAPQPEGFSNIHAPWRPA